jgi:plasmid stabilization system protein ParE
MARIRWSESAAADLDGILEYISRDAPLAAKRFAQRVFARIGLLKRHPLSGAFIAEDTTQTYREVLQGNYRIIYRYDGRVVTIVTLMHAARLLDADDLD